MSLSSRRELLACACKRYAKCCSAERTGILNEFVASTGYDRNYAIRLLNHPPALPAAKRGKRARSKTYGPATQGALEELWRTAGGICGKRLVPGLRSLVEAQERHGVLTLEPLVRERLLAMSPATCDRLLARARAQHPARGISTTQHTAHLLLRNQIPVRTFADWLPHERSEPGFFEIDLVGHCGESASGSFLHTLTATDVCSGWTECVGLPNKGLGAVSPALDTIRQRLCFDVRGIDCDNGGEFINHNLVRYCKEHQIAITRCRPYKKNDQCRVEQKNGNIVRAVAGYERFESPEALRVLGALYRSLSDFQNFFQPSMKLISKSRSGAKLTKRYDTAKTPYQRLMECEALSDEAKRKLTERYNGLNPAALSTAQLGLRRRLRTLAVGYDPAAAEAIHSLASLSGLTPDDCAAEHPSALAEPLA